MNEKVSVSDTKSNKAKTPYKTAQLSKPFNTPNSSDTSKKSVTSPFRILQEFKQTGALNRDMEVYMTKLLTIFFYYASYGDKMNVTILKSSKFHKMLSDAQIEKDGNKITFELVYSEICRNGLMGFQQFLDALVKIATMLYQEINIEEALFNLVSKDFNYLYQNISDDMSSSTIGKIIDEEEIPHHVISLLIEIEKPLFEIYNCYYKFENSLSISYEERFSHCLAASFKFLVEFDICPAVITKPTALYLFQHVVSKSESPIDEYIKPTHVIGKAMTFPKFIEYFIKIGLNSKISTESISLFGNQFIR